MFTHGLYNVLNCLQKQSFSCYLFIYLFIYCHYLLLLLLLYIDSSWRSITMGRGTGDCLDSSKRWFYFLSSSLIVFFAGAVVILLWRIVEHFVGCGWTAAVSGRSRAAEQGDSEKVNIAARIKWKCEKLVSGQTLVGRIVVSCVVIS